MTGVGSMFLAFFVPGRQRFKRKNFRFDLYRVYLLERKWFSL